MHPVIPWLAGLHSPVPDLLRVLCSACPSTPHNAIHEKLLARRAGLSPDPAAFRDATTDPVCATTAGAALFTRALAVFRVPCGKWLPVLALSRVDHDHNVRLLPKGSRIKTIGC